MLLRRIPRRFSTCRCFLEGFLEGTCKGFSEDKVLRRVLRSEDFIEGAYYSNQNFDQTLPDKFPRI